MAAYIVRRLIWVFFLLIVVTLITFIVFTVLPAADPAVLRAGRQPSPELIESIRRSPVSTTRSPSILALLRRHLAIGRRRRQLRLLVPVETEVLPQILNRLPATIFLTAGAVVLWLCIAIPIGVISAVRTGSWIDRLAMTGALIAISAPVYFLGLVALFLFDDNIGRYPLLPGARVPGGGQLPR